MKDSRKLHNASKFNSINRAITRSTDLRDAHLFIDSVNFFQSLADFAYRRISPHAVDDERHRVSVTDTSIGADYGLLGSGFLQRLQGAVDFAIVAAGA